MGTGILDLPYSSLIRIGRQKTSEGISDISLPSSASPSAVTLESISVSAERDSRRYIRRLTTV